MSQLVSVSPSPQRLQQPSPRQAASIGFQTNSFATQHNSKNASGAPSNNVKFGIGTGVCEAIGAVCCGLPILLLGLLVFFGGKKKPQ
ncbi:MAG: hypothetical protein K2X66_08755 [Cyanobacteria bacterium]|nr:hypothetical protein [Cyanobacteriota bacterium]